jgi:hypothetical protein
VRGANCSLAVARCLAGCVYSVTGCTADSSRVESGVWWWHCPTCSSGVFPPTRGGEAHPPHSEVGAVRGHLPARVDGDELTHGELPLPHLGYPAALLIEHTNTMFYFVDEITSLSGAAAGDGVWVGGYAG